MILQNPLISWSPIEVSLMRRQIDKEICWPFETHEWESEKAAKLEAD